MSGKLIVIEGVDGAGKETQTKLLIDKMWSLGNRAETLSFPIYESKWGKKIKRYLAGEYGDLKSLDPMVPSFLYAMDREEVSYLLSAWLSDGKNVVLDRYMESNLGHQGAKLKGEERSSLIKKLVHFEHEVLGIPRSDLVVYLDLPVSETVKAIQKRNEEAKSAGRPVKDIHQENIDYLAAVRETYLEIAALNEHWKVVDCMKRDGARLTKEQVSFFVWDYVSLVLK